MAQPNRWSQFTAPELRAILIGLEERWTELEKRIKMRQHEERSDPAMRAEALADLNQRYLLAFNLHQELRAVVYPTLYGKETAK